MLFHPKNEVFAYIAYRGLNLKLIISTYWEDWGNPMETFIKGVALMIWVNFSIVSSKTRVGRPNRSQFILSWDPLVWPPLRKRFVKLELAKVVPKSLFVCSLNDGLIFRISVSFKFRIIEKERLNAKFGISRAF